MNNKIHLFLWGLLGVIIGILLICLFMILATRNMDIGPGHSDYEKHILGDYYLHRTSSHWISITPKNGWNDESAFIPSEVLQLNVYENYILAYRYGTKNYSVGWIDTVNNPTNSTEKDYDYWILDEKNKKVYKFMSLETYNRTRDSLKIPEIKLITPADY